MWPFYGGTVKITNQLKDPENVLVFQKSKANGIALKIRDEFEFVNGRIFSDKYWR